MDPFFSVITTTRNCERDLGVTLSTLKQQTFRDFEWVVQDGLSSDGTLDLIEASGLHLNLRSERDSGIYDAMNKACARARGEWVLCLQAGDWLAGDQALETLQAQIRSDCDIAICSVFEIDIEGNIHHRIPDDPVAKCAIITGDDLPQARSHWLAGLPCHQGLAMRRSIFDQLQFDLSFRISADLMHLFSAIAAGHKVQLLQHPLAWYPNGGYSYENSEQWIQDMIRLCIALGSSPEHVQAHFHQALEEHTRFQAGRRRDAGIIEAWLASR